MRALAATMLLAGFAGAVSAGELEYAGSHYADSNDYAGQAYYRLDFGATQRYTQSVGLRFDHEQAALRGAPALFKLSFGVQGLEQVAVSGLDLRGLALSANQGGTGGGFFANLSAGQWVALGLTVGVFGVVVSEAASTDETFTPTGTGGT